MALITDFDSCPHCGDNFGYYTKVHSNGKWHDNTSFDHITKQNTEMMDCFHDTWESSWYYCFQCHKKIAKREK